MFPTDKLFCDKRKLERLYMASMRQYGIYKGTHPLHGLSTGTSTGVLVQDIKSGIPDTFYCFKYHKYAVK